MNRHYYKFWLVSNRGTDEVTIRVYSEPQSKEDLKVDLEDWCSVFGAWTQSDIHYGWAKLSKRQLPRNRKDALARWAKVCKQYEDAKKRRQILARILSVPPFNGGK